MSEQHIKALSRTLNLLPEQEARAVGQLAAMSPDVAKDLHTKLLSELGSQALAKEMPDKSKEMKGWGNNRASVGTALAKVVKEVNDSPTATAEDRAKLSDAVAAASGMDRSEVFAKLQRAKLVPADAEGIYKDIHGKIETNMGAAITKTATSKAEEVYFRYQQETKRGSDQDKAYTPPTVDANIKKELSATLDIKFMGQGLSDKQKAAVMTIVESSPEYAEKILKGAKALAANPLSGAAKEALLKTVDDAAVDYTIKSGGNNAKVVDAMAELAPLAGRDANKGNFSKWLQKSAAAKMDSQQFGGELAHMAADDPNRPEVERKKAEADRAREKSSGETTNLLDQPGGMMMMFIALIMSVVTGKDMISGLMGGNEREEKGQGQGQAAAPPAATTTPPAPTAAPSTQQVPAPEAEVAAVVGGAAPSRGGSPTYATKIQVEGGGEISTKDLQKALKQAGMDLGSYGSNRDGVDGKAGRATQDALLAARAGGKHAGDSSLKIYPDELKEVQKLAMQYDERVMAAQYDRGMQGRGDGQVAQRQAERETPRPNAGKGTPPAREEKVSIVLKGGVPAKQLSAEQWHEMAVLTGEMKPRDKTIEITPERAIAMVKKLEAKVKEDFPGKQYSNVPEMLGDYKFAQDGTVQAVRGRQETELAVYSQLARLEGKPELAEGGDKAKKALTAFQKARGLEVGAADLDTLKQLTTVALAAERTREASVRANEERTELASLINGGSGVAESVSVARQHLRGGGETTVLVTKPTTSPLQLAQANTTGRGATGGW